MTEVLIVKNLTKIFNRVKAINNISFSVRKGEVVGLLGPNGAGKTTTINILTGTTLPDCGKVSYFNLNFFENKRACLARINYSSAYSKLLHRVSVGENLEVFAHLYQVENYKEKMYSLAKYFGIEDLLNIRFLHLSSGQKTRVNLVKALINDPELLLLDEPTASLDPDMSDKTLTLIENIKKTRNISLLYTSHDMREVTRICDRVIFMDHGQIVANDTPLGLTKRLKSAILRLTYDGDDEQLKKLILEKGWGSNFPKKHVVEITGTEKDLPSIIFKISNLGIWITDIEVIKPTLDDVFLQIVREGEV